MKTPQTTMHTPIIEVPNSRSDHYWYDLSLLPSSKNNNLLVQIVLVARVNAKKLEIQRPSV